MLMVTLIAVAAIYVFAGADFLAIAHIMIYVGGVLVLILFSIMLTRRSEQPYPASSNRAIWTAGAIAILTFFLLSSLILKINYSTIPNASLPLIGNSTVQSLGKLLVTNHIIAFELAGIVLMVALMGASWIATQHHGDIENIQNIKNVKNNG